MNKEIKEIDIKALHFRDELINLCEKYNCEITGSHRDDGGIALEIIDRKENRTSYYDIDTYNNYNISQDDEDYNTEYIMDNLIMKAFDKKSGEMAGLNNVKVHCGVITNDWSKAHLKFQELRYKYTDAEVERFIIGKEQMELRLSNGKRYVWLKPILNSKGYRCKSLIIDRNISLEELNELVIPICYACGRDDIEIF